MITLQEFTDILKKKNISVPEDSLEVFRDLIDMQSDLILDEWIASKEDVKCNYE